MKYWGSTTQDAVIVLDELAGSFHNSHVMNETLRRKAFLGEKRCFINALYLPTQSPCRDAIVLQLKTSIALLRLIPLAGAPASKLAANEIGAGRAK